MEANAFVVLHPKGKLRGHFNMEKRMFFLMQTTSYIDSGWWDIEQENGKWYMIGYYVEDANKESKKRKYEIILT